MKRDGLIAAGVWVLFLTFQQTLSAAAVAPVYPKFPPMQESIAYQQFRTRPLTENSKLLYLIDRFAASDIEISYDGHYYSAEFTGRVARWFLARRYQHETAEQFIMKWCNASIPGGNLIWVKFPKGRFRLAREVLLEELKVLNKLLAEQSDSKTSLLVSAAVAAQMAAPPSNPSADAQPIPASGQALAAENPKPAPLAS